jgi:hypothetical protein
VTCRYCKAGHAFLFMDLDTAPSSDAYLNQAQLHAPESWYPLCLLACEHCGLMPAKDYAQAEMREVP